VPLTFETINKNKMSHERFMACIEACNACAVECEHCASQCLEENDVQMLTRCIELDRECAIACRSAAALMSVGGENADLFCDACAEICDACAEECEKHDMDHCKKCAEACRSCAEECRQMTAQQA
jgi:hypothetical protein